jgi:4'-phosphopantetheinyl transferase
MRDLGALVWHSAGEQEIPADPAWLTPTERARAETLQFTKRRNDYLLGRFAGKSAVARAMGLDLRPASLRRIEVRNRSSGPERGAPEAFVDGSPARFEISLTDRAGWGICMLNPAGSRVGCDLELVEERSDAFVADYLTSEEQAFVAAGADAGVRSLRANLVWSAKESVLKVLRTGLRRDTRSVEVRFPGANECEGWGTLRASSAEGVAFEGWWGRFGEFLLTVASDGPMERPQSLVDPPALERAKPSHSWLEAPLTAPSARPWVAR